MACIQCLVPPKIGVFGWAMIAKGTKQPRRSRISTWSVGKRRRARVGKGGGPSAGAVAPLGRGRRRSRATRAPGICRRATHEKPKPPRSTVISGTVNRDITKGKCHGNGGWL